MTPADQARRVEGGAFPHRKVTPHSDSDKFPFDAPDHHSRKSTTPKPTTSEPETMATYTDGNNKGARNCHRCVPGNSTRKNILQRGAPRSVKYQQADVEGGCHHGAPPISTSPRRSASPSQRRRTRGQHRQGAARAKSDRRDGGDSGGVTRWRRGEQCGSDAIARVLLALKEGNGCLIAATMIEDVMGLCLLPNASSRLTTADLLRRPFLADDAAAATAGAGGPTAAFTTHYATSATTASATGTFTVATAPARPRRAASEQEAVLAAPAADTAAKAAAAAALLSSPTPFWTEPWPPPPPRGAGSARKKHFPLRSPPSPPRPSSTTQAPLQCGRRPSGSSSTPLQHRSLKVAATMASSNPFRRRSLGSMSAKHHALKVAAAMASSNPFSRDSRFDGAAAVLYSVA
ncbi:unnamed protein product [Phaeothamnion confervicola]